MHIITGKISRPLNYNDVNEISVDPKDLIPYLYLPSGLSYKQAKNTAAEIKKTQENITGKNTLPITHAIKMMCWCNGLPNVKSPEQALDIMIKDTFDLPIENMKLLAINNGKDIVGLKVTFPSGRSSKTNDNTLKVESREHYIKQMVENILPLKKGKSNSKFLNAVKNVINEIGHEFYTLPQGKSLDEIESIHDINIFTDKLLFNGSHSSNSILRYALASCYNTKYTSKKLLERAIENYIDDKGCSEVDLTDKYIKDELSEYAIEYAHFGGMCYQGDDKVKRLVKGLLDNYCGW